MNKNFHKIIFLLIALSAHCNSYATGILEGVAIGSGALYGIDFITGKHKKAKELDKLENYMLGRYQEAYAQAFSNWYRATLDPTTGRPPAYDGHWAMDIGIAQKPEKTLKELDKVAPTIPIERDQLISEIKSKQTLNTSIEKFEQSSGIAPKYRIVVLSKPKTKAGVTYQAQWVAYPMLPQRK